VHISESLCSRGPWETCDQRVSPPVANRLFQLRAIQRECQAIFARKNADYGDAFSSCGPVGVMVRLLDKMQRFIVVRERGINLVNDECLKDTVRDLCNYGAMLLMLMEDAFPDEAVAPAPKMEVS